MAAHSLYPLSSLLNHPLNSGIRLNLSLTLRSLTPLLLSPPLKKPNSTLLPTRIVQCFSSYSHPPFLNNTRRLFRFSSSSSSSAAAAAETIQEIMVHNNLVPEICNKVMKEHGYFQPCELHSWTKSLPTTERSEDCRDFEKGCQNHENCKKTSRWDATPHAKRSQSKSIHPVQPFGNV